MMLMSHFTHFEVLFTGFLALIINNISEKGVRTIHKAKVYTSSQRVKQGVRLIYGCVLYTRNYGMPIHSSLNLPLEKNITTIGSE